jgi:UDP-glucose 4-epimerase
MRFFITGGAGFIGSHLIDKLISKGDVVVYDNLSLGKKDNIEQHIDKENFKFHEADLLDIDTLKKSMKGCDVVWHLAAESDVRPKGGSDTHFEQGLLATYNVLKAMKFNGIKKIAYSSSSVVYGDNPKRPTPEDYGPLAPISFYGASKLSSEAHITAFCHNFGMQAWIFRFANIVGARATHGVILDFITQLNHNQRELEILGDGNQEKSYVEVNECVDAMLFVFERSSKDVNYFNIGCRDATKVRKIADLVTKKMGLDNVKYKFAGSKRGWVGDIPLMLLDVAKINEFGWKAKLSSDQAVEKAIEEMLKPN